MCQTGCKHENRHSGDCKIPYKKGMILPCEMDDEAIEAAEEEAREAIIDRHEQKIQDDFEERMMSKGELQ